MKRASSHIIWAVTPSLRLRKCLVPFHLDFLYVYKQSELNLFCLLVVKFAAYNQGYGPRKRGRPITFLML